MTDLTFFQEATLVCTQLALSAATVAAALRQERRDQVVSLAWMVAAGFFLAFSFASSAHVDVLWSLVMLAAWLFMYLNPGGAPTHVHFKGGAYREVLRGRAACGIEEMEQVVAYEDAAGRTWFRSAANFDEPVFHTDDRGRRTLLTPSRFRRMT